MGKDGNINDNVKNATHAGMSERSRIAPAHAGPDNVLISASKKAIQVSIQSELVKTGADSTQGVESTHHQIYYLRQRISEKVAPLNSLKPVGLSKALEDTLNLGIADPTYKSRKYACVVFYNQQTLESFQIIRNNVDIWDLSMPVYESDSNVCNTHRCQTNTEQMEDIVTKFFEGGDWRGVKKFEFDRELFKVNGEHAASSGRRKIIRFQNSPDTDSVYVYEDDKLVEHRTELRKNNKKTAQGRKRIPKDSIKDG